MAEFTQAFSKSRKNGTDTTTLLRYYTYTNSQGTCYLTYSKLSGGATRLYDKIPTLGKQIEPNAGMADKPFTDILQDTFINAVFEGPRVAAKSKTQLPEDFTTFTTLCRSTINVISANLGGYQVEYHDPMTSYNFLENQTIKLNSIAYIVKLNVNTKQGMYADDNDSVWVCVTHKGFPEALKDLQVIRMTLIAPTDLWVKLAPRTHIDDASWDACANMVTSRTISLIELFSFATRKAWFIPRHATPSCPGYDEYSWHPVLYDDWIPNGCFQIKNGVTTHQKIDGAWTQADATKHKFDVPHYTGVFTKTLNINDYVGVKYALHGMEFTPYTAQAVDEAKQMALKMTWLYNAFDTEHKHKKPTKYIEPQPSNLFGGAKVLSDQVKKWFEQNQTLLYDTTNKLARNYIRTKKSSDLARLLAELADYDKHTYDALCGVLKDGDVPTLQTLQLTKLPKTKFAKKHKKTAYNGAIHLSTLLLSLWLVGMNPTVRSIIQSGLQFDTFFGEDKQPPITVLGGVGEVHNTGSTIIDATTKSVQASKVAEQVVHPTNNVVNYSEEDLLWLQTEKSGNHKHVEQEVHQQETKEEETKEEEEEKEEEKEEEEEEEEEKEEEEEEEEEEEKEKEKEKEEEEQEEEEQEEEEQEEEEQEEEQEEQEEEQEQEEQEEEQEVEKEQETTLEESKLYLATFANSTFGKEVTFLPLVTLNAWTIWFDSVIKQIHPGDGRLEYMHSVNNLLKVKQYCDTNQTVCPDLLNEVYTQVESTLKQYAEQQMSVVQLSIALSEKPSVYTLLETLKLESFGGDISVEELVDHVIDVAQSIGPQSTSTQLSAGPLEAYFGVFDDPVSCTVSIKPEQANTSFNTFVQSNKEFDDLTHCGLSPEQIKQWTELGKTARLNLVQASRFARATLLWRVTSIVAHKSEFITTKFQSAGTKGTALLVLLTNRDKVDVELIKTLYGLLQNIPQPACDAFKQIHETIPIHFNDFVEWVNANYTTATCTLPCGNHTHLVSELFSAAETSTYDRLDVMTAFFQHGSALTGGGFGGLATFATWLSSKISGVTLVTSSPNIVFACPDENAHTSYMTSYSDKQFSEVEDAYSLWNKIRDATSQNCTSDWSVWDKEQATTHTYEVSMSLLAVEAAIYDPLVAQQLIEVNLTDIWDNTTDSVNASISKIVTVLGKTTYYAKKIDSLIFLKPELDALLQNAVENGNETNIAALTKPLVDALKKYLDPIKVPIIEEHVSKLCSLLSDKDYTNQTGAYANNKQAEHAIDVLDFIMTYELWYAFNTTFKILGRLVISCYKRWYNVFEYHHNDIFAVLAVAFLVLNVLGPYSISIPSNSPLVTRSFEPDFSVDLKDVKNFFNSDETLEAVAVYAQTASDTLAEVNKGFYNWVHRLLYGTEIKSTGDAVNVYNMFSKFLEHERSLLSVFYFLAGIVGVFVSAKWPQEVASGKWQSMVAAMPQGIVLAHVALMSVKELGITLGLSAVYGGAGYLSFAALKNLPKYAAGAGTLGLGLGGVASLITCALPPLIEYLNRAEDAAAPLWNYFLAGASNVGFTVVTGFTAMLWQHIMKCVAFLASSTQVVTAFKVATYSFGKFLGLTHTVLPLELAYDATIHSLGNVFYWSGISNDAEPVFALVNFGGRNPKVLVATQRKVSADRYVTLMYENNNAAFCCCDTNLSSISMLVPTQKTVYGICQTQGPGLKEFYLTYVDTVGSYRACNYQTKAAHVRSDAQSSVNIIVACAPPTNGTTSAAWGSPPIGTDEVNSVVFNMGLFRSTHRRQ